MGVYGNGLYGLGLYGVGQVVSIGSPENFLYLAGRLVKDPTDLQAAFPHGGTALGSAKNIAFRYEPEEGEIRAEEFGGTLVETIRGAQDVKLAAVLREYDSDAINAIFPDVISGLVFAKPVARIRAYGDVSGATVPGSLGSTNGFKLLIAPRTPDTSIAVMIYLAIPSLAEQAELQMKIGTEAGIAVLFRGVPDGTGRISHVGTMEDLAL